jgi:molybdopterin/thiamine biosynthesis adenylyltransferase
VDDDVYDKTNLNRCSLAGTEDLNQEKTAVLASRLEEVGIASFPFSGDLRRFVNDGRVGMRADVAEEVGAGVYRMVVSCVDKGDGRQDIQGLHPQWLLGGSTLDLQAKTNVYAGERDAVCLGCHNAREHQGEARDRTSTPRDEPSRTC